jgi:hypothetical protein
MVMVGVWVTVGVDVGLGVRVAVGVRLAVAVWTGVLDGINSVAVGVTFVGVGV